MRCHSDGSCNTDVCSNGDVRLVGGASALEGRIEVCDDHTWGTVCDDFWSSIDAGVACVQLGYQGSGVTLMIILRLEDLHPNYRSNCVL